jgi:putative transferase (TIGR04331 family)
MILKKKNPEILIISKLRSSFFEAKNNNILFLNDGCKLSKNNKKYKYELYKNNRVLIFKLNSLEKNFIYLINVYEILLKELHLKLNKIHEIERSIEYWRILIGPWLFEFISIIFYNWKKLKYINNNFKIKYVKIAKLKEPIYPFKDTNDFSYSALTDEFNNQVYRDLLRYFENIQVRLFTINENKKRYKNKIFYLKEKLTNFILRFFNLIFKNNIFIHEPYFSSIISFFLQIRLWQFPLFYKSPLIKSVIYNKKIRNQRFNYSQDRFVNILKDLIFKYIPGAYLENFKQYNKEIKNINWAKNPKIIFSSNSFFHDDFFKLWIAEKKIVNSKFISGQHGGNFFISKFNFLELHQRKISDKILTWGYKKENIHKPMFNFITCNKHINFNPEGNLLLVDHEIPRFPRGFLAYNDFLYPSYLESKLSFIKNLNNHIRNKLVFRPFPHSFDRDTIDKLKEMDKFIRIDRNKSIYKSLSTSRICFVNLNSTVLLETLSLNFPTIIFFNPKQDLIRKDAKLYFSILKRVNVYFDDEVLAAKHLNKIWTHVDKWWYDKKTQNAVTNFCNRFSRRAKKPTKQLALFFKQYL